MPRRTVSFLPCRTQVFAGCLPEMAQAIKRWNYKKTCSVFKRLSHNPPFSRRGEHFLAQKEEGSNEHKKVGSLKSPRQGPSGLWWEGRSWKPASLNHPLCQGDQLPRLIPFWSTRLQARARATVRPAGPALSIPAGSASM